MLAHAASAQGISGIREFCFLVISWRKLIGVLV
jgi:hypothetical protein